MKKMMLFIGALAFLCSCSSFLEEKQTTGISSPYSTEEMLESDVFGIIAKFSGTFGFTGEPMEIFSIPSGLTHWAGSARLNKHKWESSLYFTQYSTTDTNNKFFRYIYNAINGCNVLIASLPDSPVDESYKKEIEAEARFYRAVLYFSAVRLWGDLPLRLETISVESSTNCPRTHFSKVYMQIIEDFEYAAQYMRSPARVKEIGFSVPRPDRYAPVAFLSSVYVTIGSLLASPDDNFWDSSKEGRAPDFSAIGISSAADAYAKALEYAERIIPGTDTYDAECRYRLVEKFSDLFMFTPEFSRNGYDAWMNPEQIFSLTYTPTCGLTSYMSERVLPKFPAGSSHVDPAKTNGNMGRWRPNRWVFQKWCETYPGDLETVKFKGKDVTLYMNGSDPRIDATLYFYEYETTISDNPTKIYPQILNTHISSSNDADKYQCFPYFRKYWSYSYNYDEGDHDFYFMRFAEVYLNAAEAAAYLDDEVSARQYIEVLHARARHSVPDGEEDSDMPSWENRTFADKDELLSAIFWERIFELYGEGHEWNETHRHGAQWLVDNISVPKNAFLDRWEQSYVIDEQKSSIYPQGFRYSTDPVQTRKALLAAFPYNEFLYNEALSSPEDQNDFYLQ